MIHKFILIASGFFYSSLSYSDADSTDVLIINSKKAIYLCIEEYLKISGSPISDEINNILVQSFDGLYGINFSRGEVGFFGKQSLDYKLFLSCAITHDGEIKFLGLPFGDSLIGKIDDVGYLNVDNVTELLFYRRNNELEYCCSQIMDDNNFDKHNPELIKKYRSGNMEIPIK